METKIAREIFVSIFLAYFQVDYSLFFISCLDMNKNSNKSNMYYLICKSLSKKCIRKSFARFCIYCEYYFLNIILTKKFWTGTYTGVCQETHQLFFLAISLRMITMVCVRIFELKLFWGNKAHHCTTHSNFFCVISQCVDQIQVRNDEDMFH